ncbi:unnamed protein product [Adineta steineri]|uniref:Uncharacterized protein n=1 Tax=Adineta steineri TaxID=433720 RepID=A0A819HIB5_9BILA|nr:unnamed protein product [Adineta steineri]CAF3897400.1 unnamed protein product [Adineta steineri]
MEFNNIETCDNEQVNSNSEETSTNQLRLKCFQKRKSIWIIISIVLLILIIIIPIIIIKTKKNDVKQISTTEETRPKYKKYNQQGITVAGGNGEGDELNQLFYPGNIIIDENKAILIADNRNHRIVKWKYGSNNGQIIAGGNRTGDENDQLRYPIDMIDDKENDALIIFESGKNRIVRWFRKNQTYYEILVVGFFPIRLAMDKNGFIYVSENHEVRRWKDGDTTRGIIVAGGNGKGNQLNQLDDPGCIFIDDDYTLYVSDWGNNRVMKWTKGAKEGIIAAGGNGDGNNLNQLTFPAGLIVDQLGHIYVADMGNHRVMRWCEGDGDGSIVVGGNGEGEKSNQLNSPTRLLFDDEGNLYVVDEYNHRVQKFEIFYD